MPEQNNLGFLESQRAHIEAEIYQHRYGSVQYPGLIPVDVSADQWTPSVTYYASDVAGSAKWMGGKASDFPTVSESMQQFSTPVYMAGIGYDYSLEELENARRLNLRLDTERGITARRIYEEFVDGVAFNGDTAKGMSGLLNYAGVTTAAVPNGAGGNSEWHTKTPDEVLADVNAILTGVYSDTQNVAMADTLLMPYTRSTAIATRRLSDHSEMTILDWLRRANVYTAETGQQLTIRGLRGLDTAGVGSTARMVAYQRAPDVLKMHIPMPIRFLPAQQMGVNFQVPGIFRLGGLDIRRPKEVRYADGI